MTLYQIRECDICNREMARWTSPLLGWTECPNVCDDCKAPFEEFKKQQRMKK